MKLIIIFILIISIVNGSIVDIKTFISGGEEINLRESYVVRLVSAFDENSTRGSLSTGVAIKDNLIITSAKAIDG